MSRCLPAGARALAGGPGGVLRAAGTAALGAGGRHRPRPRRRHRLARLKSLARTPRRGLWQGRTARRPPLPDALRDRRRRRTRGGPVDRPPRAGRRGPDPHPGRRRPLRRHLSGPTPASPTSTRSARWRATAGRATPSRCPSASTATSSRRDGSASAIRSASPSTSETRATVPASARRGPLPVRARARRSLRGRRESQSLAESHVALDPPSAVVRTSELRRFHSDDAPTGPAGDRCQSQPGRVTRPGIDSKEEHTVRRGVWRRTALLG